MQTPQTPTSRLYFKGFNALRLYAALSVMVQHVSYSPHDWFGTPLLPVTLERLFLNGTDAVNLFFILSGFLITYLLLVEHDRTGSVSVRRFYIRRALRIYPVYFAFLLIVIVLLRPAYPLVLFLALLLFAGNAAFVVFFPFPPLEHLWSIAVEEQYYLLAPLLARHRRAIPRILLFIIGVWWLLLIVCSVVPQTALTGFIFLSRYDLIALGALLGYAHHQDWPLLARLRRPGVRLLSGALIGYAIIFTPPSLDFFYTTALALAFAILIENLAASPRLPTWMTSRPVEFLGNLSYSLYVYHPLVVLLFYTLFYQRLPRAQYPLVAYPVIIGISIGLAAISYRFLEKPLLRFKDRFRRV